MVSAEDLRNLRDRKVKDFALMGNNRRFSVVFDNQKALQFYNDPVDIIDVIEERPFLTEDLGKDNQNPFLKRINIFIDFMWKTILFILKIIFMLFIIFMFVKIIFYWSESKEFIVNFLEAIKTWTGTP